MTIKVWFVREGPRPTRGDHPSYELPLQTCIETLGLEKHHWKFALKPTPQFGKGSPLSEFAGNRYVVYEIDDAEAKASGWKAGFYLTDLAPNEAVERLGTPRSPLDT